MGVSEGSWGGGEQGEEMGGGDNSEDEMKSLWTVCSALQFVFFIHRVLVTWYFKTRCVNCVLHTQFNCKK